MNISVIIPVINESKDIRGAIESAWKTGAREVIVVDGGSNDDTIAIAESLECQIVESALGRGRQQNAGAAQATSEVLLFLHADTRLGLECGKQISSAMNAGRNVVGGGFRQRIDQDGYLFRWLEKGNAARVRWQQLVYGDQGLFVRSSVFQKIGGFPDFPLMEDFELSRCLSREGRVVLLDGPIQVNARRWRMNGVFRQTARNWMLTTFYRLGVSPNRLNKFYRRHDSANSMTKSQPPKKMSS